MSIAECCVDLVEILWSSCAVSLRTAQAEHKLLAWAHDPGQADKPDPLGGDRAQVMLKDMYRRGITISDIARVTGHDRKTVRSILNGPVSPPPQWRKTRVKN